MKSTAVQEVLTGSDCTRAQGLAQCASNGDNADQEQRLTGEEQRKPVKQKRTPAVLLKRKPAKVSDARMHLTDV